MSESPLDQRITHETITRYRYSSPEVHGHTNYETALAFAQDRERVNGTGNVSVQINRLEDDDRWPDGLHHRWIETIGGIR